MDEMRARLRTTLAEFVHTEAEEAEVDEAEEAATGNLDGRPGPRSGQLVVEILGGSIEAICSRHFGYSIEAICSRHFGCSIEARSRYFSHVALRASFCSQHLARFGCSWAEGSARSLWSYLPFWNPFRRSATDEPSGFRPNEVTCLHT